MATVRDNAFLAIIFVFVLCMATETFGDPPPAFIPPFIGRCDKTVCGRGICRDSTNNPFGFECDCLPGWRQARPDEEIFLNFLPCIIPNCTLDYSCGGDRIPRAGDNRPYNERNIPNITSFDPCSLNDCGGGRCNKTSPFTRNCECDDGYYNLLNSTLYPCYRQCAFSRGCPGLGYNSTTEVADPFFPGQLNGASLVRSAELACFIAMVTTLIRLVLELHSKME